MILRMFKQLTLRAKMQRFKTLRTCSRSARLMASMKNAVGPASLKLSEFPLKNQNMENNMPISSVNARVEKVNSVYGIVQATAFT